MAFLLLNVIAVCTRVGCLHWPIPTGFDRRELQQLKLLAEGFFDALREQLASCARNLHQAQRTGDIRSQASRTYAQGRRPLFFWVRRVESVAALVKADAAFARALVDCVISGKTSQEAAGRELTTVEEHLLTNTMAAAVYECDATPGPIVAARSVGGAAPSRTRARRKCLRFIGAAGAGAHHLSDRSEASERSSWRFRFRGFPNLRSHPVSAHCAGYDAPRKARRARASPMRLRGARRSAGPAHDAARRGPRAGSRLDPVATAFERWRSHTSSFTAKTRCCFPAPSSSIVAGGAS